MISFHSANVLILTYVQDLLSLILPTIDLNVPVYFHPLGDFTASHSFVLAFGQLLLQPEILLLQAEEVTDADSRLCS